MKIFSSLIFELIGTGKDIDFMERYTFIFILLCSAGWVGISYLAAYLSGWRRFAEVYKKDGEFDGRKHYFKSAGLGLANYGGCLIVGANNRELFLGMIFLLKLGHKDLLIPLAEVKGTEIKRLIFFKYVRLTIKGFPKDIIQIDKRTADLIERESENAWQYERVKEEANA